jgi:1,4-dihydroxy-2-naphthoyl-CoA hydrolase
MMAERTGVRMATLGEGFARGELDVSDDVRQPAGFLHGGALLTLADTVATVGAIAAAPPGRTVLTASLTVAFMRPVRSGTVIAEARELHRGGELSVWDVEVRDREARLIAKVLTTLSLRSWPGGTTEGEARGAPRDEARRGPPSLGT